MNRILHPFRGSTRQLGPLEQRMLDGLWAKGTATVRELIEYCCQELAYTTVMTTLDRLFKKGLLTRSEEGRAFRYAPRFSRQDLHREAASQALLQLLESSPASALPLSYFVEILGDLDSHLLDDLQQLVERKRREIGEKEILRKETE